MKYTILITLFICLMIGWQVLIPREPMVFEESVTMLDTFVIEDPVFVESLIIPDTVRVTIYHAVEAQTDSTPNILASGIKIDITKAGSYRFCALSRDLLERWDGPYSYGDTIYLEGAGKFSGPWIVQDTMNKRFKNRIDLLVDHGTYPYSFEVATIRRI